MHVQTITHLEVADCWRYRRRKNQNTKDPMPKWHCHRDCAIAVVTDTSSKAG